mgnify:CR=1 FL=1
MSPMDDRATLVLGGSGFVGRHLVARLAAAGRQVIVPTRRRERARHLILLPTVDVVEVDVHDEAVLVRLARRASVIVNLVGILNEPRRGEFERCPCRARAQARRRLRGGGRIAPAAHERAQRRSARTEPISPNQG